MSLTLIFGPMFSGKTTEMMRLLRRHRHAGRGILVLRYKDDTRYVADERTALISSHDHQKMPATPVGNPWEAQHLCNCVDVIGIDEGQFMPDLLAFVKHYTHPTQGKHVVVASLDGTYQMRPFQVVENPLLLIPLAEHVVKLTAVCETCGTDAAFTKRIVEGDAELDIGGKDKYAACCRSCFFFQKAQNL